MKFEGELLPGRKRGAHRLWTQEEIKVLQFHWGHEDLSDLASRLGRTEHAVSIKARKLELGAPSHGNGLGLNELSRKSGFSTTKILAAAKVLGLKLRHTRRSEPKQSDFTHKFSINEEQEEALLAYMLENPLVTSRTKDWVPPKPSACLKCSLTERPHFAKGLCSRCYLANHKAARKSAALTSSPEVSNLSSEDGRLARIFEQAQGLPTGEGPFPATSRRGEEAKHQKVV